MGYSGSGKSTLTRTLAERYDIPSLHLDAVYWSAGWTPRDHEEALHTVSDFLKTNESWVIDGNYQKLLQKERLDEADKILILQLPRLVCLFRAFKRLWQNKGRTRPDMAAGCEEKVDAEFVWWILHEGRSKAVREGWKRIQTDYPQKVRIFKSKRSLASYLKN